jgi:hypothetical protein
VPGIHGFSGKDSPSSVGVSRAWSDNRLNQPHVFVERRRIMQRDAKFGLVIGVVLVMVISVLFSRQEPTSATQPDLVSASKLAVAMPETAVANAAMAH